MIFSCKGCEKRTPGCHGKCPTYKEERAKYDELKAEEDRRRAILNGLFTQRGSKVYKAIKSRRKGKYYG